MRRNLKKGRGGYGGEKKKFSGFSSSRNFHREIVYSLAYPFFSNSVPFYDVGDTDDCRRFKRNKEEKKKEKEKRAVKRKME